MNLNIKRHNFTNQSSILLKKIDDVGRANVLTTSTYWETLFNENKVTNYLPIYYAFGV